MAWPRRSCCKPISMPVVRRNPPRGRWRDESAPSVSSPGYVRLSVELSNRLDKNYTGRGRNGHELWRAGGVNPPLARVRVRFYRVPYSSLFGFRFLQVGSVDFPCPFDRFQMAQPFVADAPALTHRLETRTGHPESSFLSQRDGNFQGARRSRSSHLFASASWTNCQWSGSQRSLR